MWRVRISISMPNFDQFWKDWKLKSFQSSQKKHFSHPVDCITMLLSANRHPCYSAGNRTKRNYTCSQVCAVQFLCSALISSHKSVYSHRLLFLLLFRKARCFQWPFSLLLGHIFSPWFCDFLLTHTQLVADLQADLEKLTVQPLHSITQSTLEFTRVIISVNY